MRLDPKFVNDLLDPNPDPLVLKKTFVDTGDMDRLREEYLYRPGSFLLAGDRGSGKTTLFRIFHYEFLATLERKFDKKHVLKNIGISFSKIFLKDVEPPSTSLLRLPAYMIVNPIENLNQLKISFIANIIGEIAKQMLFVNKISSREVFKTNEELQSILFKVKGIKLRTGAEMGIMVGNNFIPITIKDTAYKDMTSKVTTLPRHYNLLDDLYNLIQKNDTQNPHFILFLDEFDKIKLEHAGKLLSAHQAILFERFRRYCSFVIPCTLMNSKKFYGAEYKAVYNFDPFEVTPFNQKHTKELLNKRLKYYKSKLVWDELVSNDTLKEIGEGAPRIILGNIKSRIKENEYEVPI